MNGRPPYRPHHLRAWAVPVATAGGGYLVYRALRRLGRLWHRVGVLVGRIAGRFVIAWLRWASRRPLLGLVSLLVAFVVLVQVLGRR